MSKYSDVRKVIFAKWPKAKIKSIKEFPEGYNNVAYLVNLGNLKVVVKIIKFYKEKYILKQKKIRALMRKRYKNFPIPKIITHDSSKKIISEPYIIAEYIEGKSLNELFNKIKNINEIWEEVGSLYGKIHYNTMKAFGELDHDLKLEKTYPDWSKQKNKEVKKLFTKIKERKLLTYKQIDEYSEFYKKNKRWLKYEIGPVLTHGDASLQNIIVKKVKGKYKISGIIDFEFARAGGAVYELFSGWRTFKKKFEYRESFVKGYSKFNKLPKRWEEVALLYFWLSNLKQLTNAKNMKWRNLTGKQIEKRKRNIINNCKKELKNLTKNFEKIISDKKIQ